MESLSEPSMLKQNKKGSYAYTHSKNHDYDQFYIYVKKMHVSRPYLLHILNFIQIKKNWNSNLNYFQQLLVQTFPRYWYIIHKRVLWFVGPPRPIKGQFQVTGKQTPDSGSFFLTYTQFKESVRRKVCILA